MQEGRTWGFYENLIMLLVKKNYYEALKFLMKLILRYTRILNEVYT